MTQFWHSDYTSVVSPNSIETSSIHIRHVQCECACMSDFICVYVWVWVKSQTYTPAQHLPTCGWGWGWPEMNSQLSCLSVCVCGWPPDCHRVSVCHTRIVADHRSRYMYGMSMSRVTTSLSMPYHRVGCYGPEVLLVLSIAHRFHT